MDTADRESQFLNLHMPCQRRIFGYLVTLVRDFSEAENLQQEVAIAAWKGFATFEPGKPYLPWVFGISRHIVSKHWQKKGRAVNCLPLEIVEGIAEAMDEHEDDMARERTMLSDCVAKLTPERRELLRQRYEEDVDLAEIGRRMGSTLGAVNALLCRIREALLRCVSRAASREEYA